VHVFVCDCVCVFMCGWKGNVSHLLCFSNCGMATRGDVSSGLVLFLIETHSASEICLCSEKKKIKGDRCYVRQ